MFPKVLFAIVAAACIGASLLALRHQRLAMKNEMARLHMQMDQTRRETWDLQTQIAQDASPEALRQAIERNGIELEPLAPMDIHPQHQPHAQPSQAAVDPHYAHGVPR